MLGDLFELLRRYFAEYGYWTLIVALLLENAGVPLPGETTLLFASYLAYSEAKLHLGWIIVFGTIACTLGDNLGYWIGRRGGRPLLDRYQRWFRLRPETLARGERLFERHGTKAIFVARFIAGMRIIAGPLAGVLRMPWRDFLIFNFLGAVVWVTVIASVGFLFGQHLPLLVERVHKVELWLLGLGVVIALLWWWRRRRSERA